MCVCEKKEENKQKYSKSSREPPNKGIWRWRREPKGKKKKIRGENSNQRRVLRVPSIGEVQGSRRTDTARAAQCHIVKGIDVSFYVFNQKACVDGTNNCTVCKRRAGMFVECSEIQAYDRAMSDSERAKDQARSRHVRSDSG